MKKKKTAIVTLRQSLARDPVELSFGTSGLRGLVQDITSLEAYVTVRGFLSWLLAEGTVAAGSEVFLSGDLRPSTTALVAMPEPRGEILQAALRAAQDSGLVPVFVGLVPTPALVLWAMGHKAPSIMVTGSHIPFDRNGIKLTTPAGEVTKDDEPGILAAVKTAREVEYERPAEESLFDTHGMMKPENREALPAPVAGAAESYGGRFTGAFPPGCLSGSRILVWEHSAVGREILASVLASLGATVVPAGRTDQFVPVDTEAVDDSLLHTLQGLVDAAGVPAVDAVVSTDGDSDRPLLLAVENGRVRFVPGDLLGVLAADFLGARSAAVPISVNDAVDRFAAAHGMELQKTRIGSPYVVAALRAVGWEANGGFLTGEKLTVPGGGTLSPLPTRDAVLPLLAVLCASLGRKRTVASLLDDLPRRFGASVVLRDFSRARAREIMTWLSPSDPSFRRVQFLEGMVRLTDRDGAEKEEPGASPFAEEAAGLRARVTRIFSAEAGFSEVEWMDWLDGVRVGFGRDEVVHLRPSGNAPEMRVYVVTGSAERTAAIAATAVAGDGTVRRLEREAGERAALAGFRAAPRPVPLQGAVQHYAWGGTEFIPRLIGAENPQGLPWAELWMGTHPRGPATADIDGARISLDRLIEADPFVVLGPDDALRFAGRLPYLFKVLDVRVMASIQAHPSRAQAEEGFARENAAGIPLDAPTRSYRDENHKPEVHVVLTDFWMLHGFRPLEEIAELFSTETELGACMPDFDERRRAAADPAARAALLKELYAGVMTMPQSAVNALLDPLVARLEAEESRGSLDKGHPGFWALRAAREFPLPGGARDRGIVSVYLLNLVRLRPGQGTFQPAGTPHAYLEGATVELMANSDNVLRGGLTPKHVDVNELLATLDFKDGRPPVLEGRAASETGREYETPAEEFALERIEVNPGTPWSGGREHGVDTLIATEGAVTAVAAGRSLSLSRGSICLVPAGVPYSIAARAPRAVLYKAGIPPRTQP